MLHNKSIEHQIATRLQDYFHHNDTTDVTITTVWEAMKTVIRGELIAISAAENKARKDIRAQLTAQVQELERVHSRTSAPRIWRQLKSARAQLAQLDLDRAEYAAVCLKHAYYVGGNRTGRMLANRHSESGPK